MQIAIGESSYTKSVSNVVRDIRGNTPVKDSLFEQAQLYFEAFDENKNTQTALHKDIENIQSELQAATLKTSEKIANKLKIAKQTLKNEVARQEDERICRLHKVELVCSNLLMLSEAENWQKTQVNSAKLLGTLLLLSPGEGTKLAYQNQRLKPAYKAVIAIRLLDKLLKDEQINNQYINERYQPYLRYSQKERDLTLFQHDVLIPIMSAALFQDVGSLHPSAQLILKGESGKLDEFRILDQEDRQALRKINNEQTLHYITHGLGMQKYVGNSKEERAALTLNEKKRLNFIRSLLISAYNAKLGIGNLIKVPQIYASVIFSSKQNHSFSDLPKAMLFLSKAAQRDNISKVATNGLLAILGHFPQGYGIIYIPKEDDQKLIDCYEYAIVTELNPADPFVPKCRIATRNLTFIAGGKVISIDTKSNLYFPAARKKLEKISPARLEEILRKLASNFEERKALDIFPSYWNPHGFFAYKKLQNLWKRD
ncbi:MAG: hypothetical protein ACJA0G_001078 [Kangiellaceae bacterium]|jgi:hypothetical protein